MNAELFSPHLSLVETVVLFIKGTNHADFTSVLEKWKNHKRYKLSEIVEISDYRKMFDRRRSLYALVSSRIIRDAIRKNEDLYLLPYFFTACAEGWSDDILIILDDILLSGVSPAVKTRALSCTADLLSARAGILGGLRSGPGSNPTWSTAFSLLLNGDVTSGAKALMSERLKWLERPDHLMRASRHYERAVQVFIQRSVQTVKEYIVLTNTSLPDFGRYVTAECPARIDLQGGWSDTPPICYELGGSVVNVAILVDGKLPVGARACRTRAPHIRLKIGRGDMFQDILITNIADVLNYNQPNAQGALLKAALICTDIVDVSSKRDLSEELMRQFGGGFEIQSWSLLPQGCGMGTSSILAGAIVSVLWSVSGKIFDKSTVIHAVLHVEQLLTTGGGWQDQVAGIMGGFNRGYSHASLPLCVQVEPLSLEDHVVEKMNAHLLLIYTGKVRLAKNLLQNVIRNWYAREENVVKCFRDLITHSFEMKTALIDGDLPEVGRLMNEYWEQKKVLAPGCEPSYVREVMDILHPSCHGQILVGAGGGGFMCVLTKQPNAVAAIGEALKQHKDYQKLVIHSATVHTEGLQITS